MKDFTSEAATRGRVLVVDDDAGVLGMLERVLISEGFDVVGTANSAAALAAISAQRPDVVLLDLMLADEDGLEVLVEIRRNHDIAVILVTGRGDEVDRVLGLRMGADDYVVKPFSYPELVARIDSVLRRSGPVHQRKPRSFGRLTIDTTAREVRIDAQLVDATAKEFDLLAFLTASPRQVFSRGQLLEQVWVSSAEWQDPATVTEHVRRLRLKIESEPEHPKWIVTVRGVGYRFEP
jgi:DNA-binding response OmpR family regulator